jgi:hypothetical protein
VVELIVGNAPCGLTYFVLVTGLATMDPQKVFFLSYASPSRDDAIHRDLVVKLFRELCDQVGEQIGFRDAHVGFLDRSRLESGTPDYQVELHRALTDYPIGVVLLSPAYLSRGSSYCRWEFESFLKRNEWADGTLDGRPRTLLVLDWIPTERAQLPSNFPRTIQSVREDIAGADDQCRAAVRAVLSHGLKQSMTLARTDNDWATRVSVFVHALARYINKQRGYLLREKNSGIAPPLVRPYSEELAWASQNETTSSLRPLAPKVLSVHKKVAVLYAAAHPSDVPVERAWRYELDGDGDWHAFARTPGEEERISSVVGAIDGVEVVPIYFRHFERDPLQELGVYLGRYPVIVVVDPWTTSQIERFRAALQRCAESGYPSLDYLCPIVVWNESDDGYEDARQDFESSVSRLFLSVHWQHADSRQEFLDTLWNGVRQLRSRIMKSRASAANAGGGRPPRISGVAR